VRKRGRLSDAGEHRLEERPGALSEEDTMLTMKSAESMADSGPAKMRRMRELIRMKNEALLSHRYFRMCRAKELEQRQLMHVLKQVYCFSTFFERLLTRRVTEYPNHRDPRVLKIARDHLRNEMGHVDLFRQCLLENGVAQDEIAAVAPKMFTKAMFGYLTTTILHENEYVTNVAMMQVMESIGYYFFKETLSVMQRQAMSAAAFADHVEADEHHLEEGFELIAQFDRETTEHAVSVIEDLYRLMEFMLDEWLGLQPMASTPPPPPAPRRRRTSRPPKVN
jgi:pyrroloquinoline quinone (PQQ) biosynthesis protein C